MKNLKALALVLVLIFAMGTLAACGSKTEPATTEPAATEPAATEPAATEPAATEPAATGTQLVDGVYTASYDNFDSYGWKAQVEIEVKESKIANVKFDYVNKDGALKSKDEAYKAAMEPVAKISPEKAFNELQAALVTSQDAATVQAVAGATVSSNDFLALAAKALEAAATGATEPVVIPLPQQ